MAYSRKLLAAQEELAQTISRTVLGGEGVKRVFVERTYEPQRAEKEETLPQMITSSAMIGSNLFWANGYPGVGSRIAVIDTGTDTDHQSFDNGAFLYALEQNAMAANMTKETYASAHNILADEVIAVLVFDVTDQVEDMVTVDVGQSEINNETGGIGTTIEIEVPAVEVCPSERFVDIYENEWYHEAVDYVVKNGLMIGMDETHFEPNSNMTRAQLVQVLYRMAGSPETEAQLTFTDVAKGQWYYDAVAWASANGITMGIDETHFAPNDPVTREQMVTFFARFAKSNGIDTSYQGDLSDFTDAGKVSDYAVDAMTWAYEIGLINGMENHRLNPGWTAQRSQAATVLMRYCLLFID